MCEDCDETCDENAVRDATGECEILCDHESMCQHCGMIMDSVKSCDTCGARAHDECVSFDNGKCDACRFHLTANDRCALCKCPERASTDMCGGGLIRQVVYHGRHWMRDDRHHTDSLVVDSNSWVAEHVVRTQGTSPLRPEHLPENGTRPMHFVTEEGTQYVSIPFVVHTWCAAALYQQTPRTRNSLENHWSLLIRHLDEPKRADFAETNTEPCGVMNDSPCIFCGGTQGIKTFCQSHFLTRPGHSLSCKCHWNTCRRISFRCFHPSCAVRKGMYRVVDPTRGGTGMMCQSSFRCFIKTLCKTKWPSNDKVNFLRTINVSSGINRNLLDGCPSPIVLPKFDVASARLGGRRIVRTSNAATTGRLIIHRHSASTADLSREFENICRVKNEMRLYVHEVMNNRDRRLQDVIRVCVAELRSCVQTWMNERDEHMENVMRAFANGTRSDIAEQQLAQGREARACTFEATQEEFDASIERVLYRISERSDAGIL